MSRFNYINQTFQYIIQLKFLGILNSKIHRIILTINAIREEKFIKEVDHIRTYNDEISRSLCIISLNNYQFAIGGTDFLVKIWNIEDDLPSIMLEGHIGDINSLLKLNDNEIASCSSDKTVIIWSLLSNKVLSILDDKTSDEITTLLNISVSLIASGSSSSIIIWNYKTLEKVKVIKSSSTNKILGLELISDDIIASCNRSIEITLWDLKSEKVAKSLTVDEDEKGVYCILKLNKYLFASGHDSSIIRLWSIPSFETVRTIGEGYGEVVSILKLSDNLLACSRVYRDDITIWNFHTGKKIKSIQFFDVEMGNDILSSWFVKMNDNLFICLSQCYYDILIRLFGDFSYNYLEKDDSKANEDDDLS